MFYSNIHLTFFIYMKPPVFIADVSNAPILGIYKNEKISLFHTSSQLCIFRSQNCNKIEKCRGKFINSSLY